MHRSSDLRPLGLFHYRLYGLSIASEMPLPELHTAEPAANPDVRIKLGESFTEGTPLVIDDIASFRISKGSLIHVEPKPGAADRNVRLYLLGSAMGMLLHQRGLLPLHANAVEIDGKAVAFMGPSGSGKSTLAAWFHDRGHRVIADDVCVVSFDGSVRAWAEPGMPRMRLWQDALEASGRRASQYQRAYAGDENWRKFDVQIEPDMGPDRKIELSLVFELRRAESLNIYKLEGAEAADSIFANTYRGHFVKAASKQKTHWLSVVELVRRTSVFRLERPWGSNQMNDYGDSILGVVSRYARKPGAGPR